jgi:hypothetical protein
MLTQQGLELIHHVTAVPGENSLFTVEMAVKKAIPLVMFFKGQRIKGEWLASLPPGSIFHR